jgi:two-component system response regulator
MEREVEILLVDDSPSDVELTIHALRRNNLANQIHVAEDGQEALEFIFCRGSHNDRSFSRPPTVILLDLKMPKVDGLGVLRAIREDERTKAIPVVILTSSAEQKDLIEGYRLGVVAAGANLAEFGRSEIADGFGAPRVVRGGTRGVN